MDDLEKRACAWILGGQTGLSSKAIWATMLGVEAARWDHPHDPDDMVRCLRLLREIPEWRARLPEMSAVSAYWAVLVAHWDEIEQTIRAEIGGLEPYPGARAPKAYALMRQVLDAARDRR